MRHEKRDNINFYNGDCMEFMKNIPDKFYELAIIDPPYGIGEDGSKNHTRGKLATSKNYKPYHGNDLSAPDADFFKLLIQKSKNQIIWGANHFIDNMDFNRSSPCWIVWDKDNGETDFADCELAWTSFSSAVRKFKWRWQGMLQQNMKNKDVRIHPNQKPIALYRWLLQNYAKKGDKILDTHGGSMTHAIACDMEGYALDIIEIDEDYFNDGLKAFDNYKRQLSLF